MPPLSPPQAPVQSRQPALSGCYRSAPADPSILRGLTWLPAVRTQRVLRSFPHFLQGLHAPLVPSSHHLGMVSLQAGQDRARRAAACTLCTCRPSHCVIQERRSHQRDKLWQTEGKEEGKRSLRLRSMERVQRPVGAPEPAEHRQGQRGWRLKCTQTVREE